MNVSERCLFVEDISEQSSASRSKERLPSPSGSSGKLFMAPVDPSTQSGYCLKPHIFNMNRPWMNKQIHWFSVKERPLCEKKKNVQFTCKKYPDLCGRGP